MIKLGVKVVPGASRNEVVGWLGDDLKVRVAAPPEGGKANRAVVALLAETLGVPPVRIRVVSGTSSARKGIEIDGLTRVEMMARLSPRLS